MRWLDVNASVLDQHVPALPGRAPGRSQAGPDPLGGSADVLVGRGAPIPEQRLRPRGSNHVGMRQFNERVVLQAIRLNGSVSKADIARLTRLTPQTVQIIIARLEADALVKKLEPTRGKVGQPSVPMALNPDGAFSIGIKIGRRSLDMLLLDFTGQVGADRHPRKGDCDDRPAGRVRQGHGRRLRGRTGGRSRPRHRQLSVRLHRHLHRQRPRPASC